MKKILVLNGPNLNLLGLRESDIYGAVTLADIQKLLESHAEGLNVEIGFKQSNHEGELVTWIQQAKGNYAGIIINAAAFTHTSIAIHDALRYFDAPIVEVHLSNVYAREPFRHHSYISSLAVGVICGLGADGYVFALQALIKKI